MNLRFPVSVAALFILWIVGSLHAADKPVPAVEHALVISVDGLRPDLLLRANMPRVHKLLDQSSYTMWARTVPASITLPSHVSMLTGVPPEVHGIMWNGELPLEHPVYPAAPTIFEVCKRAGLSTAMSAGKSKFAVFDKPGVLDWKYIAGNSPGDGEVIEHAVQMLRDHKPALLFVHLPMADNVGHAKGWGSPEQMAALEQIDHDIGKLLDALDELKLTDSTFILLTADHGGAGRTHGPEDPRSRTIPWIVAGPGIRKNFDLTRLGSDFNIETYDTFTTTCTMLGVASSRRTNGKFVQQILDNAELTGAARTLTASPATQPANSGG